MIKNKKQTPLPKTVRGEYHDALKALQDQLSKSKTKKEREHLEKQIREIENALT